MECLGLSNELGSARYIVDLGANDRIWLSVSEDNSIFVYVWLGGV